jgi:hypothetical protein
LWQLLPTVEFGCLEAILVKTSFQLGLAKCVLTCRRQIRMFNSIVRVGETILSTAIYLFFCKSVLPIELQAGVWKS